VGISLNCEAEGNWFESDVGKSVESKNGIFVNGTLDDSTLC